MVNEERDNQLLPVRPAEDRICGTCGNKYKYAHLFSRSPNPEIEIPLSTPDTCNACLTIHIEKRKQEDEEHQRAVRLSEWRSNTPTIYRETDLAKLPVTAKKALDNVLAWECDRRGLILAGPTGQGKTRLAHLLLKRLIVEEGRKVEIVDSSSFNHEYLSAVKHGYLRDWARDHAHADILFFDDLGKLRLSDGAEAELFTLIERRTAWGRPFIITTNDVGESLKARMSEERGEPLLRRLREFCDVIAF